MCVCVCVCVFTRFPQKNKLFTTYFAENQRFLHPSVKLYVVE